MIDEKDSEARKLARLRLKRIKELEEALEEILLEDKYREETSADILLDNIFHIAGKLLKHDPIENHTPKELKNYFQQLKGAKKTVKEKPLTVERLKEELKVFRARRYKEGEELIMFLPDSIVHNYKNAKKEMTKVCAIPNKAMTKINKRVKAND